MLDINKITFTSKESDKEPFTTLTGRLVIQEGFQVAKLQHGDLEPDVKRLIRTKIWNDVYGDLRYKIIDLQRDAMLSAHAGDRQRVEQLCREINQLMKIPQAPNEKP